MDNFIDKGFHWVEVAPGIDSDVRTFRRGLPAPMQPVEAGRIHELAAELDRLASAEGDDRAASAYIDAADRLRELLK